MMTHPYGFRILGPTTEPRRLVDAGTAFAGYAACDPRAEVNQEAYLSAFCFGEDFRQRVDPYRRFAAEHADRLDQGLHTLESLANRLAFVRPPFDLENVAASADAFQAELIVLDYLQRIPPPGQHGDKRAAVNATMDYLRQFADAGVAVRVVAAVGRTKDAKGRTSYSGDGLNLASFRESSELEFGADDAFIIVPDDTDDSGTLTVTLRHLKARHGEPKDLRLVFDRRLLRFTDAPTAREWKPDAKVDKRKMRSALSALWGRTKPAADEEGDPA
jgi:replicative DNA helicase